MVASGAQAHEVEARLRRVLDAHGAPAAVVMVSFTSVTVSDVAEDSAEATTAVEVVRRWDPGYHRLVLTGSLLRFLPGAALVAGMRDFLDGALASGTTRLVEVVLLGAAVAVSAGLVLAAGPALGVQLSVTAAGTEVYPISVLLCAGATAVTFYGCQLGVPARGLFPAAVLGALAVLITRGIDLSTTSVDPLAGTLVAALVIGAAGQGLAQRSSDPPALWIVPAILPLLPAPATLIPLLAETEAARQALRGQALGIAFCIGVGVAVGSIAVQTWSRRRRDVTRALAHRRRQPIR